tara:strand:- start:8155 stop:8733 length:579 start_codon:yes stop_codon:yes gene_type:complete
MQEEDSLKDRLVRIFYFLPKFYINPIQQVKFAPKRDWLDILLIQGIVALMSGIANGLLHGHYVYLFWGIFIFPIVAIGLSFVFALIVHYGILIFFQQSFPIRRTYHLVVLANLPFLLIRVASPIFPSLDVLGFLMAGFLLSVGMIEDYRLPKEKVIKLMAALIGIVLLSWLIQQGYEIMRSPQSFDVKDIAP